MFFFNHESAQLPFRKKDFKKLICPHLKSQLHFLVSWIENTSIGENLKVMKPTLRGEVIYLFIFSLVAFQAIFIYFFSCC